MNARMRIQSQQREISGNGDGETYAASLQQASVFPETIAGLLGSVFNRWEKRFGTTLVAEATTLIACSKTGLAPDEVFYMLTQTPALVNLPVTEWEALQNELETHVWPTERLPGVPALAFFHHTVKHAVLRRFADAAATRRQKHLRVACFFARRDVDPSHRSVAEVLWGTREGKDWHALRALLTDPHVHALMWNQDTQVDLATHW